MTTIENLGWWLLGHPLHAALVGCLLAGVGLGLLLLCTRRVELDDAAGPVPAAGVHRVDQLPAVAPARRRRPDWRTDVAGVVAVPLPARADADLADTARLSWAAFGMAHAVPPDGTVADDDRPGRHRRPGSGTATW